MHLLNAMLVIAMAVTSFYRQNAGFEWNKKSTFNVEHRVEFPGIVLEPGTYVIRLQESSERRSTVQILSKDEETVLATAVAVPDHRVRPEDNSEFTFHEVRRGPRPVHSWFYTGDLLGLEFVYAKPRAKEIASDSGSHVMASNGKKDSVIVALTPNGKEVVIDGELIQTARRKPQ